MPNCFLAFCSNYWRTSVVILAPLLFLPIPLLHYGDKAYLCMYTVLIMASYWVTEAIPLGVTSLLPIVLFPLMDIMSTSETCELYYKDTTFMLMTSIIIAIAVEHVDLHKRIALHTIMLIGCSIRKMSFGLMFVTLVLSMWISNTAACAMMVPIALAVLQELEKQGLSKVYQDVELEEDEPPLPSKVTNLFLLSIAYSASVGGAGTLIGTGTNLSLKGIFESMFPKAPEIAFAPFFMYSAPISVVMACVIWVFLNVLYTGMLRPKSTTTKDLQMTPEAVVQATDVIRQNITDLGPMKSREIWVAILFIIVVILWFFRSPGFMQGWPIWFTDLKIGDATPTCAVIVVMFILPSDWAWLWFFSKKSGERKNSPSLLSWDSIEKKVPWALCFLIGSGFVLSAAGKSSGMSSLIGSWLTDLKTLPPLALTFFVCMACQLLTEFSSNVAMSNIVLPILAEMAIQTHIHPFQLMLPAALSCSYAFMLPVGTPPNAYISGIGHVRTSEMLKTGVSCTFLTLLITVAAFKLYAPVIYPDLDTFPDYAKKD